MSLWQRLKRWFLNEPPVDPALDAPLDPERATFVPGRRKFLILAGTAAIGTQIPGWVTAVPETGLLKSYIEQFQYDEKIGLYRMDLLIGAATIIPRLACRISG